MKALVVREPPPRRVSLVGKLIACVLILACVVLGLAGLVLPLIPGLLFLAIAAILLTKTFPTMRRLVRKNPTLNRHFEKADRVSALTLKNKLKLGALICARAVVRAADFVTEGIQRGTDRVSGKRKGGRTDRYP